MFKKIFISKIKYKREYVAIISNKYLNFILNIYFVEYLREYLRDIL